MDLSLYFENTHVLVTACLSVMLFSAFLLTRITKRLHLPNVTGYILAGVVIGPFLLGLVPQSILDSMEFLTDAALAMVAFGMGRYLKIRVLKQNGWRVVLISLMEALVTAAVVMAVMFFLFRLPLPFALMLGAIAAATSSASTIMTIRQYRAKGRFIQVLLEVLALDNVIALIAFSICAAVAQAMSSPTGSLEPEVVLVPLVNNLLFILLGLLMGYILHKLVSGNRSPNHRLVLTVAMLLLLAAICSAADLSPLLSCMAMGFACSNLGKNKQVFKQLNRFSPPVMALFFVLSGMRLDLGALAMVGGIGLGYFIIRMAGKYLGAWLGALITGCEQNISRYLGLTLIPQAGVSIGLALLAQRILPEETGGVLSAVILASAVLYELIGPACAKGALFLSGSIRPGEKAEPVPEEEAMERMAELAEQNRPGIPEPADPDPRELEEE